MMIPKEELAKTLINIYNFGYTTKNKRSSSNEEIITIFEKALKTNVTDRIDIIYKQTKFVIIEENYVEPEWKEMIARHYIHSAYASSLRQRVIRIHFLSESKFSEDNYLGYITLRPLEEIAIALSFVYVNWKHRIFDGSVSYVMTYPKEVHYMGQTILIHTYPFFAQDSIVTCCADANVIMLIKYFSNKYNFVSTSKMSSAFVKPSKEQRLPKIVDSTLLERMLTDAEIAFRIRRFRNVKKMEDIKWIQVQENIDTYIESGLPVILGIDGHVVQLIGHIDLKSNMDRSYIVYDDSGHLEKLCLASSQKIQHKFSYILSMNDIKNYFQKRVKEGEDRFFILMAEHERVYIDFVRYQFFLVEYLFQYAALDRKKESILSCLFDNNNNIKNDVSFRNMLVDNSILKDFLLQQRSEEQAGHIDEFLRKELPHYLWYTEIKIDDKKVCLCADPTMYYATRDIEKLFLYTEPIAVLGENCMSLLTKCD